MSIFEYSPRKWQKSYVTESVLKRLSDQIDVKVSTEDVKLLGGRLQRTSAKISDFQTTPPPLVRVCPNFQNHPPPLPGRPRPDFSHIFQFLHIFIFAH